MNTRLVLIVGCVLAGVAGWYLSQSKPVEATNPTAGAKALSTSAQSPIVLPVKAPAPVVQVAKPIVPAAPVVASAPAGTASNSAPAANEPQPQTDLKSCVSQMMALLQSRDLVALVKTVMPPTAQQRMIDSGQASDPETMAAQIRASIPTIDQDMTDMLQALQSVQGQEPEMNKDGTQAIYHLSTPIGRLNDIKFEQQDGKWYFN
jgi:hypothetical protein